MIICGKVHNMRTIIGMLLVALVVTACGKKGPLVYPEMLVPAAPAMFPSSRAAIH